MAKSKEVNDKKPDLEPQKEPDGTFKTDRNGMVVYGDPGPDSNTAGTVTHHR